MNFYLSMNGQKLGPYSVEKIQIFLKQSLVTTTNQVRADGGSSWMPIGKVPELASTCPSGQTTYVEPVVDRAPVQTTFQPQPSGATYAEGENHDPVATKNPYYVLGVPSFANAGQLRSAYVKRVKVLHPYHFDKATQPSEWQMVNDMLQELNEAYAQVRSSVQNRNGHSETKATPQRKPRPAEVDNDVHAQVSMGDKIR
jgi:hypothetical protein